MDVWEIKPDRYYVERWKTVDIPGILNKKK
jgi:hypothetical protein